MAGGGASGVAVGTVAVGGILIWSGVRGAGLLRTVQELVQGKKPSGMNAHPVATPTGAAAAAGGGSSTDQLIDVGGTTSIDGHPVASWLAALVHYARAHGWHGTVTSGYRSYADQVRVCSTGVQPCAKPGTSHHQGLTYPDGAIDVTDAPGLVAAVRGSGLVGADRIQAAGAKDPPHISIPGSHRAGEGTY